MSSTYSGNPNNSAKDAVRFTIQDTDIKFAIFLDGEIEYVLSQYNQVVLTASVRLVEIAMTKFARMVDETVGQVKIMYSQKYKAYESLLASLRQRIAIEGAMPYAGGISKLDKDNANQDPDRIKPDFTKHQMENRDIAPWVNNDGKGFARGEDD